MRSIDPVEVLCKSAVVPIIKVDDLGEAEGEIDALVEGGANVVEIVLRTELAPAAIANTIQRHSRLKVAAGTVLDIDRYRLAEEAGAHFVVSPGLNSDLADFSEGTSIPLVPGAVTPSEVMFARDRGFNILKFYPSEPVQGREVLSDYKNLFPEILFMPTAGITEALLPVYGRLANVACVGGSWMLSSGEAGEVTKAMSSSIQDFMAGRTA